MTPYPEPDFAHLCRMTDQRGTFEHARFTETRTEHGYCTDDVARVLVVASREPVRSAQVSGLIEVSLRFLADAQDPDGRFRNRMNREGRWEDTASTEDCWGRAIWGLGTAAATTEDEEIGRPVTAQLTRAVHQRSPWSRARSFAAIGCAEMLSVQPDHQLARALLEEVARSYHADRRHRSPQHWPWPEARLTYANAVLPEAIIAAASILGRPGLLGYGLELLEWLLAHETRRGHLSVTPVGGHGPGEAQLGFDQQPIEVAALADACARAARVDDGGPWIEGIRSAVAWFAGENDTGAIMWDPSTGGGFDGLQADGVNRNQGTESTLALLSTLQHGRRVAPVMR
jgi:hypothetical protein